MNRECHIIHSYMDQLQLSVLVIEPDVPKAVVQLLHGMSEHKERYVPLMEYLEGLGYACVIHDHRGHGNSVRGVEDYGYFYENGAHALVEDVNQVNRWIRRRYRNLPIFLIGHSMGSLIARVYLQQHDAALRGLILTGSPSKHWASSYGLILAKIMAKVYGDRAEGSWFYRFGNKRLLEHLNHTVDEFAWIAADEETVNEYEADMRCGFRFTLNGFIGLFTLMKWVYGKYNWHLNQERLPILFLSGEDDPITDGEQKRKKTIEHLKKIGYRDVTDKVYKGMRHEILNETEYMKVYHDIAEQLEIWLLKQKK